MTRPTRGSIDLPWVRTELARTHAELRAMYMLNWRMTVDVSEGSLSPAGVVCGEGVRY